MVHHHAEQAIGAIHLFRERVRHGHQALGVGDVGPAFFPIVGQAVEQALINIGNDLVDIKAIPAQHIRHFARIDHRADLIVGVAIRNRHQVEIKIEMLGEPLTARAALVVILRRIQHFGGEFNGEMLVIGLARSIQRVGILLGTGKVFLAIDDEFLLRRQRRAAQKQRQSHEPYNQVLAFHESPSFIFYPARWGAVDRQPFIPSPRQS